MKPKDLQVIDTNNKFKVIEGSSNLIKAWIKGVELEDHALAQLGNIANMPFIHKHVAVMPDVHAGRGATIGTVIPTSKAIIPAAVGVDIGCGMQATRLSIKASQLPDNLSGIRSAIEAAVPHGRTDNGGANDKGAWNEPTDEIQDAWADLEKGYKKITEKHPKIFHLKNYKQLGTLGGGNHFIEICIDENQDVWVMLHSGSRGPGGRIGMYFINLAKEDMRKYFINLPDIDLAYIPEGTDHFKDYIDSVRWAQNFARINREVMMKAAVKAIKKTKLLPKFESNLEAINCHHNYVEKEKHFRESVWVTRKGAVNAEKGRLGIIPGSMGAKSFIVRGLGNKESFSSCSHGAGRRMSRTEAKSRFTIKDHKHATQGIECRKDKDVIDETPAAYKDIDAVMNAQNDLVEVVHTLKQVVCVKG